MRNNSESAMLRMLSSLESRNCLLHFLKEIESSQHFHQWQLDAFSIQNYVIKKERPRGARHGKTEAQKDHFIEEMSQKEI